MADPKKGPGHHDDCVPDGACSASCKLGNPTAREATLTAKLAQALQGAGLTVHTDAKAYGVPATVIVQPDGSAYRLDVFELREPVQASRTVAPPAVELKIDGAVTVKGESRRG